MNIILKSMKTSHFLQFNNNTNFATSYLYKNYFYYFRQRMNLIKNFDRKSYEAFFKLVESNSKASANKKHFFVLLSKVTEKFFSSGRTEKELQESFNSIILIIRSQNLIVRSDIKNPYYHYDWFIYYFDTCFANKVFFKKSSVACSYKSASFF